MKAKIIAELEKLKLSGELSNTTIQENIASNVTAKLESEQYCRIDEVIFAVVEFFPTQLDSISPKISAAIRGYIQAIRNFGDRKIDKFNTSIATLEIVAVERKELIEDINLLLKEIQTFGNTQPEPIKQAIWDAVDKMLPYS